MAARPARRRGLGCRAGGVRSQRRQDALSSASPPTATPCASPWPRRWRSAGRPSASASTVEAGGTTAWCGTCWSRAAYEAALFAYRRRADPDPYPAWHSSQRARAAVTSARSRTPRIDKILEDARQAPARRAGQGPLSRSSRSCSRRRCRRSRSTHQRPCMYSGRTVQGVRIGYLDNPGRASGRSRTGTSRPADGAIITLHHRLRPQGPCVAQLKAVLLSMAPEVEVVDITRQIEPQDIVEAAFVIETSWRYFPEGTIHVVVLRPGRRRPP